jgi:hypothetical protein
MKLWTPAEVQQREQQLIEMCARIAYEYGAQHPDHTAVPTANGIGRAIEAFGRIVADEWAGGAA